MPGVVQLLYLYICTGKLKIYHNTSNIINNMQKKIMECIYFNNNNDIYTCIYHKAFQVCCMANILIYSNIELC